MFAPAGFRARFAFLLVLLPPAGAAVARGDGRFLAPPAGAALESGATVRVAWTLSGTQHREPDEMELVLSLDGGRTFPVRVTRDLDPGTRSFAWRVPALPTARAQLALRTGEGGDERIELVGEEFSIELKPGAPLEPTMLVAGEWRTEDALDGNPEIPFSGSSSLAGSPDTIGSVLQIPPADAPRPPLAALARPLRAGGERAETSPAAKPFSPTLRRTPSAAPMRA